MVIYKNIYNKLINCCSKVKYESGGILGGQNNVIKYFEFDEGIGNTSFGKYYPNVDKLNHQIYFWQNNNIDFYGIAHSHFQCDKKLSKEDILYINSIMLNMPGHIECLYFPLIFPLENKIIPFKAVRNDREIIIIKEKLKII